MKVVMKNRSELKMNPHNPDKRHSEKKLQKLAVDILDKEGVQTPLLIASDGETIGEGNGRFMALEILEGKGHFLKAPCIMTSLSADKLLKLNEHHTSFTLAQELSSLRKGMSPEEMRMQTAERMVRVVREGGDKAWSACTEGEATPDGVHMASILLKRLGKKNKPNVVKLAKYIKSVKNTPVVKALSGGSFKGFEMLLWEDCVADRISVYNVIREPVPA